VFTVDVSEILGLSLGEWSFPRAPPPFFLYWGDGAPGEAMNSPKERKYEKRSICSF